MNTPISAAHRPIVSQWLLVFSAVGIIYGSLYPFKFAPDQVSFSQIVTILMMDWRGELSIPNIFANIVLFIPYGLFGILAFPRLPNSTRTLVVLTSAAILAFGIQVIQIWFSGRTPTAADGIINMGGVLLGMAVAWLPMIRMRLAGLDSQTGRIPALPLLLLLSWLAYRWFPLVPTLDVYSLIQGLKPLLLHTEWRPFNFVHNLIAWLVFAVLWRQCRFGENLLWLVIPASLPVQLLIADNPIMLHNIIAALAAPVLWSILNRVCRQPEIPVVALLIGMLFLQGLRPFELGVSSFKWIPFAGFLSGNMMINTVSLLEKLFLYGSLIWLMLGISRNRVTGLLLPVLITGSIEIAQIWISGRGAEITDPLLCVLIWLVATRELNMSAAETLPGSRNGTVRPKVEARRKSV